MHQEVLNNVSLKGEFAALQNKDKQSLPLVIMWFMLP